jgi:hypothetical protein
MEEYMEASSTKNSNKNIQILLPKALDLIILFLAIENDSTIVLYTYNYSDTSTDFMYSCYVYIKSVITVCKKYSEIKCPYTKIYIYMTPFLKEIGSNTILGPHEINSGYTRICGLNEPIVVYRKEEWLKVCIHECIHYFGIDFAYVDKKIYVPLMKGIFNIVSDHLLYESYTEFWAEMIFICLYSIETHKNIIPLIKKECIHSIQTCKKILQNMNITYTDLLHTNSKNKTPLFIEKTNVFCYYFLKTLYMVYIDDFLKWNIRNNTTLLSISKKPSIIKDLCKWIDTKSKEPLFIKLMSYPKNISKHRPLNKSLKMMLHS